MDENCITCSLGPSGRLAITHRSALKIWLVIAAVGFSSTTAEGDVVTDWNGKLVETMLAEKTNSLMQSRNAAIVHTAIFEAVNSIERRFAPYNKAIAARKGASAEAAAAVAAHAALAALYPKQTGTLDEALTRSLSRIPVGERHRDNVRRHK